MSGFTLISHRAHDYRHLLRQWRLLAARAGLKMKVFARAGGLPVYAVTSPGRKSDQRETVYISAGVHGDEAAPPWGLLEWAQEHIELLQTHNFLIFPTLNPAGLIANTRMDHRGVDLNRSFNRDDEDPLMQAWRGLLHGRRISLALCLHEDYDGQGCYLYELTKLKKPMGHLILSDCGKVVPVDPRSNIDGRAAKNGLIIRRTPPELPGHPEAIVLHWLGAPITLTFESPSEYSLLDRIAVQKAFIESSLRHVLSL